MVVDASVAIKLVIDEGDRTAARELIARDDAELFAPSFLLLEAGNILWKKARRREIDREQAISAMSDLRVLFDQLVPIQDLIEPALALAIQLDHPAYDCTYLACAQVCHAKVVTADSRFLAAGARGGLSSSFVAFTSARAP